MNNRNWGVLAVVLTVLTVVMLAFAASNPAVDTMVNNATRRPVSATTAPLAEDDGETVVLDEEATADPTMRPDENGNNPITIIMPGVRSAVPTSSPNATERPTSTPTVSPTATPTSDEQ